MLQETLHELSEFEADVALRMVAQYMTTFSCTLTPNDNITIAEVEVLWQQVVQRSKQSTFFTAWDWISSTLLLAPDAWWLQQCYSNGNLIALAIWFEKTVNHFGIQRRQLWLHKTGHDDLDRVWIEYNNFVVDSNFDATQVSKVMLNFLIKQKTLPFDELHVDMTTQLIDVVPVFSTLHTSCFVHEKLATKGYRVSLENETDTWLSKNTRYQLKRSQQLLSESGEVVVISISNKADFLTEFAEHHIQQWQHEKWGSAFTNQYFMWFHTRLVSSDAVTMLVMQLGGRRIARGYFITHDKQVFFYASAIEQSSNPKVKVGYVFHLLAMRFFQQKGYTSYDFLAGDMQYKQSLSNSCYPMKSFVIERKNVYSMSRQVMRRLKTTLRAIHGR